jgi:guanylate kinase
VSDRHPAKQGRLFVVAGPSGVGKGTVIRRLRELVPDVELSVSCTTRARREGERDGVDYRYVSDEEFDRLIADGALLEWAEIFGHHRSGTPAAPVAQARAAGRDVILEIDVQGARQVREQLPKAVLVFLAPPSLDELGRRLRSRGTEDEAQIERRLEVAGREMEERSLFDQVVVNDDVDRAAREIAAIIAGH